MESINPPLRIIVADDHALVRGGLALLIKMLDKEVQIIEADHLEQIIEALGAEGPIDLILVDLLMPGMDGFQGVRRLCAASPDTPVVVVSVKESAEDIRQAIDSGAMGYIPKTSTPEIMMSAIKLVLSGGVYLPPHLLRRTPAEVRQERETFASGSPGARLTSRQN